MVVRESGSLFASASFYDIWLRAILDNQCVVWPVLEVLFRSHVCLFFKLLGPCGKKIVYLQSVSSVEKAAEVVV